MIGDLVLSLFPGADLLGMAFEAEGFCVVTGPDVMFGRDIRDFHPSAGKFDGVIGGPPCQAFSRLRHINPRAGEKHGNLIPEFERVVFEASPRWFLMENVPEAPVPAVEGFVVKEQIVCDVWVGGETNRKRRFSFGTRDGRELAMEWLALHRPDPEPAVTASGATRSTPVALVRDGHGGHRLKRRVRAGDGKTVRSYREALRLSGLPLEFLDEAPLTVAGKLKLVGNGVPLPMGRAIAKAVRRALEVTSRPRLLTSLGTEGHDA